MAIENGSVVMAREFSAPELLRAADPAAVGFSHKSPMRMPDAPNEDGGLMWSAGDTWVAAVADGVGGGPGGATASRLAIEILHRALQAYDGQEDLRPRIVEAIESANATILCECMGAATTLCVVEVQRNSLRTYHVGDSEALLVGQRGKVKMRTLAHSPVAYAVDAGLISAEEAMHHPQRHVVSNVVGSPEMRIEVGSPTLLARRDTVVVATDGLFDNMRLVEIVGTVRQGNLLRAGIGLLETCALRMAGEGGVADPGKPDDITFIVARRTG